MLKGGKPLEIMITHKELEALNPCEKGLIFTRQYTTLQEAWNNCHRSDWMWWFLQKFNGCPKKLSIQYSQLCADHVSHLRDSKNAAASAYATAASTYATDAAVDAFAAAHTADAAAYATAYAAKSAYAAERKWQADQLRILVPTL